MSALYLHPTRKRGPGHVSGKWTKEDDELLAKLMSKSPKPKWSELAKSFVDRRGPQIADRWRRVLNPTVVKGSWTESEDKAITQWVGANGPCRWNELSQMLTGRNGKQCRERWMNCIAPTVTSKSWTAEEDEYLLEMKDRIGNKWAEIAKGMPGRSENSVKNRWYSTLLKRQLRIQLGQPLVLKRGRRKAGIDDGKAVEKKIFIEDLFDECPDIRVSFESSVVPAEFDQELIRAPFVADNFPLEE